MTTLVTDLDGTICFDGVSISPEIVVELERIAQHGRLVIASARPPRDLYPVLPHSLHGVEVIGGNGSFVRSVTVTTTTRFTAAERRLVDGLVAEHGLRALIDADPDYSYTGTGADGVIS
ncbi:MAG: HAD hydrolase family protein, partial [Mycetocola sp.]